MQCNLVEGIGDEIMSLGILMGIVWEAYMRGSHYWGFSENATDYEWKVSSFFEQFMLMHFIFQSESFSCGKF